MKRLVLKSKKNVKLIEEQVTLPKKNEVVVKLIACGICGTDKYYYNFSEETILNWGHEIIGEIVDCGEDVDRDLIGEKVITKTTNACGECKYCRRDESEKCSSWSRFHYNGFSEFIVIPYNLVIPLPENNFHMEYILTEPLNVALDLSKRVKVNTEDEIIVFGLGTIGLLTIFTLKQYGYKNIYAFSKKDLDKKNKIALDWGAKEIFYNIRQIENNVRFDLGLITTPYMTIPEYSNFIRYSGSIVYNGIHEVRDVSINLNSLHFNKISLIPSFPHPQSNFTEAISLIEKHHGEFSKIISHTIKLDKSEGAFELFNTERKDVIKIIVEG